MTETWTQFPVTSDGATNTYPYIAASDDGQDVMVAWFANSVLTAKHSTDGGATFGPSATPGPTGGSGSGTSGCELVGLAGKYYLCSSLYENGVRRAYITEYSGNAWGSPIMVDAADNTNGEGLKVDSSGVLHLSLADVLVSGQSSVVKYLHSGDSGTTWAVETLTQPGSYTDVTQMAVLDNGTKIVTYTTAGQLNAQSNSGEGWQHSALGTGHAYWPKMTSRGNTALLCWQANNNGDVQVWAARFENGAWGQPVQISQQSGAIYGSAALLPSGLGIAAWIQGAAGAGADGAMQAQPDGYPSTPLMVSTETSDGVWGAATELAPSRSSVPIVYTTNSDVLVVYQHAGASWGIVLARSGNVPPPPPPPPPSGVFVDVAANETFYTAINRLHELGIVHGKQEADGLHFYPHTAIARDELAGLLANLLAYLGR